MELMAEGGAGTAGIVELVRAWNLPAALCGAIDGLTELAFLQWLMAALATLLLATWFITSSDSGTLVITTMLSIGNDSPPQRFRIAWVSAKHSLPECCCWPVASRRCRRHPSPRRCQSRSSCCS